MESDRGVSGTGLLVKTMSRLWICRSSFRGINFFLLFLTALCILAFVRLPTKRWTQEVTSWADVSIPSALRQTPAQQRNPGKPENHTNIVFIKVHKAGSTTVSNLLARYAVNHDLHIALPEQKPYGDIWHCFGPFRPERVLPLADGQRYNVLFNHMVYNRSALDSVMPRDTFYVAIMRDPVTRFLSSAYYFRLLKQPRDNGTDNAAFKDFLSPSNQKKLEPDLRLYNSMVRDAGLPLELCHDEAAVSRHIEKLDGELDLMMVMEHFLESLLLLKRRARLALLDVLFLQTNARKNHNVHNITSSDLLNLRRWQSADHALYRHFYDKFWQAVRQEEAKGFWEELDHFQGITRQVTNYCTSDVVTWDSLVIHASTWNEEFSVNSRDCELMSMEERPLQKILLLRAQDRRNKAGYVEKRKTIPHWRPVC